MGRVPAFLQSCMGNGQLIRVTKIKDLCMGFEKVILEYESGI